MNNIKNVFCGGYCSKESGFVTKVYYSVDSNRRRHDGFSICEIAMILKPQNIY